MCKKKSIAKTILLTITLLICASQQAMEDKKSKKLPELELITTHNIRGQGYILNPDQWDNDYFLIFKHDTRAIEVWNKKCAKIDEITSTQISEFIEKSNILDKKKKKDLQENITQYMKNQTYLKNLFGKTEIHIVTDHPFDYIIRYNLDEKKFIEMNKKDLPSNLHIINPKPLANYLASQLLFHHNNYSVFVYPHYESKYDVRFKVDVVFHAYTEPTTIPITLIDNEGIAIKRIFGSNDFIIVWQAYLAKNDTLTFHDVETGKPIILNEKPLSIETIIPNWHEKYFPCPNCIRFGEKSNFMVIVATTKNTDNKHIILVDMTTLQPVAKHTLSSRTFDLESLFTLHLCKDEQEIILVADVDEKMWVFKNPLAKQPEEDFYKTERRKYVLSLEGPRAKDEKDPLIIKVNGITIPVDKNLLLLG